MTATTLEMVQDLRDNGFTPLQAECIVKQIMHAIEDSDLVTKSFLKAELAEFKAELARELTRELARMDKTLARMEKNLIKWMIGTVGSAVGSTTAFILGLIYFLHSRG